MAKSYDPLPTTTLDSQAKYHQAKPLPEIVHLDDPATSTMVNFKHSRPFVISKNAPLPDARVEMRECGVHMLLVVDDSNYVVGLITSEDILGEKPIKVLQEHKLSGRSDIKVSMVMTPREQVVTINKADLKIAYVANVIETLRAAKQHYALVVETDKETNKQVICGLFSLSQISRQLDMNVTDEDLHARSLADLQRKLD